MRYRSRIEFVIATLVSLFAASRARAEASATPAANGNAECSYEAPRPKLGAVYPPNDDNDWLELNNGEWIQGSLVSLRNNTIFFKSDHFGDEEIGLCRGAIASKRP